MKRWILQVGSRYFTSISRFYERDFSFSNLAEGTLRKPPMGVTCRYQEQKITLLPCN